MCPEMIIRQSGQDVGQEEMSQARVPDSVLQFGSYPNATSRQAGRALPPQTWRNAIAEMETRPRIGHKNEIQGFLGAGVKGI